MKLFRDFSKYYLSRVIFIKVDYSGWRSNYIGRKKEIGNTDNFKILF